jgi:hypothetical protein
MENEDRKEPDETGAAKDTESEDIRKSFASMTMEKKLSTLAKIGMDLAGEIVEQSVSVAEKVVNDLKTSTGEAPKPPEEPGKDDSATSC